MLEGGLYASDWGFRLSEIQTPVWLWQGEADTNVPAQMGRYLARSIPGCHATFYPEDGHISIAAWHTGDVLKALSEGG